MNGKLFTMAVLTAAALLASCKDKKNADNGIITTDYQVPQPVAPIAMEPLTLVEDVKWVEGNTYQVAVVRTPADSLPMVSDEMGQEYIDNVVRISVTRADGSTFFARSFGKASFANWLDNDYRQSAILESIGLFGTDEQKLMFTAIVNHPEATDDEAINLMLTVEKNGGVNIEPFDDDQRDDIIVNERK